MTVNRKAEIIIEACHEEGLDTHIKWIHSLSDVHTHAEKIANYIGRKGRNKLPVKNSYMYCKSLDMCFFIDENDKPCVAYAGYVTACSTDITENKLVEAFKQAKNVLCIMEKLIEQEDEE